MKENEAEKISEFLCLCYRRLAGIEKFSPGEIDFLLSKRGSVETIRRESAIEKYYVAIADSEITGMIAIKENRITKLYVHPDSHGKGIGKALFGFAKEAIANDDFDEIIAVAIGESAVPFYEKMGMHIVERRKSRAPGFENREGIIMRMYLESGQ